MVFIIEIVLGIVILGLLTKAILETVWGICIVIHGIFWHAIALALNILAFGLRSFSCLTQHYKFSPNPAKPACG